MRLIPLLAVLALVGCSTVGPPRKTVTQALKGEPATPTQEAAPEAPAAMAVPEPAPQTEEPSATPFSAGLMLGAGLFLDGSGRVLPAELAVGSLKVATIGQRAVNLLALGGISGTDVSEAKAAWGAGAGVELTPGTLPYEVNGALGMLWVQDERRPALMLGVTLTPKM